ncbi:MAG: hypothetical protein WCJ19_05470 [bacterium]
MAFEDVRLSNMVVERILSGSIRGDDGEALTPNYVPNYGGYSLSLFPLVPQLCPITAVYEYGSKQTLGDDYFENDRRICLLNNLYPKLITLSDDFHTTEVWIEKDPFEYDAFCIFTPEFGAVRFSQKSDKTYLVKTGLYCDYESRVKNSDPICFWSASCLDKDVVGAVEYMVGKPTLYYVDANPYPRFNSGSIAINLDLGHMLRMAGEYEIADYLYGPSHKQDRPRISITANPFFNSILSTPELFIDSVNRDTKMGKQDNKNLNEMISSVINEYFDFYFDYDYLYVRRLYDDDGEHIADNNGVVVKIPLVPDRLIDAADQARKKIR